MLQTQIITLDLDGITAGDYLAYFVDADPALEASRIRSVTVDAEPLGDRVTAVLRWDGTPAPARAAAQAAETGMLALLWLLLSLQALEQWLVGRRRQRAQNTVEIAIGMAVVAVLALAVWKVIGPAVLAKANAVATDLTQAGSGTTGTG
jgi:hypothetical protein